MSKDVNKDLQKLCKLYILEYELYLEKAENKLNDADKEIMEIKNNMLNLLLSSITLDSEGNVNMVSTINEKNEKKKPFFEMKF